MHKQTKTWSRWVTVPRSYSRQIVGSEVFEVHILSAQMQWYCACSLVYRTSPGWKPWKSWCLSSWESQLFFSEPYLIFHLRMILTLWPGGLPLLCLQGWKWCISCTVRMKQCDSWMSFRYTGPFCHSWKVAGIAMRWGLILHHWHPPHWHPHISVRIVLLAPRQ